MLYVAIAAFAIGIAVATLVSLPLAFIAWSILISGVLAIVMIRHQRSVATRPLVILSVAVLMLSAGFLRTEVFGAQFTDSLFGGHEKERVFFSGVVIKEPDIRERSQHLYLRTGTETVLVIVDRHYAVSYGDELTVAGIIEKPEAFDTDLGRTFNYAGYLEAKKVNHLVRYPEITIISQGNGVPIIAGLLQLKQKVMQGIERSLVEPQAGLAEGLLLGVKQALGDDLELAFRQSGIIHIVVLSGYNVMLVVAFFRFFMKRLPRFWQLGLGLVAITSFALVVGLTATVVRASIMAGLVLLAGTLARTYDVMRALFFAGFVMLLINPYLLLYDIGFQLSFMATFGLLLVAPRLETTLAEGNWFGAKEFFYATVATQIAVLPLLLYHIGEVSLVAVVVNVLVLPVVPFAMLGAFLTSVTTLLLPSIAPPFIIVSELLLRYIIVTASWFAGLPLSTIQVPAFSPYVIAILYCSFGLVWYLYKRGMFLPNELAGWEIVEETNGSGADQGSAPSDETPVFFR